MSGGLRIRDAWCKSGRMWPILPGRRSMVQAREKDAIKLRVKARTTQTFLRGGEGGNLH
jgi:hypothetical protein